MGREYIKYHFDNTQKDLFYELCYKDHVCEVLDAALKSGYLQVANETEAISFLLVDIENIYTGIIRRWSSLAKDDSESSSLDSIMYRIMMRFLYSFASDKYKKTFSVNEHESGINVQNNYKKRFESYPAHD
jgi:hypothetical protein